MASHKLVLTPPHVLLHRPLEEVAGFLGDVAPLALGRRDLLASYPAAFRLELEGASFTGPFAGEWSRWVKTRLLNVSPLVKFAPAGEARPVERDMRCGQAILLVDRWLFARVFAARCPLLLSYIRAKYGGLGGRGRGGGGYYLTPGAICEAVLEAAEFLGVSTPWEAAALYKWENGRRRYLQGFAALLYWCKTGRTPEGDYLLGRLDNVYPAALDEIKNYLNRTYPIYKLNAVWEYYKILPHGVGER